MEKLEVYVYKEKLNLDFLKKEKTIQFNLKI